MLLLHHYQPLMAAAVAKFPSEPWVALGAEVGVPLQPLRSPEEALHDPAFLADGCVTEVVDPELGAVRQVGRVLRAARVPDRRAHRAARSRRRHRHGARRGRRARRPPRPRRQPGPTTAAPRVAARRRPGARPRARGRRSVGNDDAGRPRRRRHQGQPAARLLLDEHAHRDVLQPGQAQHRDEPQGSRRDGDPARAGRVGRRRAAQHALRRRGPPGRRLREPARDQARPDLLPHARLRARRSAKASPGNDQTGAALAGPDWLDGGLDHDGIPFWPVVSLGDTGNGFLSAIAIVQALYHRDRTGEGQFVDTSIMYAQLLNASIAWSLADGSRHGDRPQLDAMQLGWHACYRLYETADGWLCVAAVDDAAARRAGGGPRRGAHHGRHRVRRAGARVPHAHRRRTGSRRSTPPACRARSRPPTSCSICSTTRR